MNGVMATRGVPFLRQLRDHRLAITALVAIAAGDDFDAAIERLERAKEAIPRDQFKPRSRAYGIARDVQELADACISDLERLKEVMADG